MTFILYIIHLGLMFRYMTRYSEELGYVPRERFSERDPSYRIWGVLLIEIFVPTGLLLIPVLPAIHILSSESLTASILEIIFYSGNIAMLSVLITLEFVQVLSIQQRIIHEWHVLLVGALALDIMLLFVYTLFMGSPNTWLPHSELATRIAVGAMILTMMATFYSTWTAIMFIEVIRDEPGDTGGIV